MKGKIIFWISSAVFVILSVLLAVFLSQDLIWTGVILGYMLIPALLFIGVGGILKAYEWLLYSLAVFATTIMLLCDCNAFLYILPFMFAFMLMIGIRVSECEPIGRILLGVFMQLLCAVLLYAMNDLYTYAKNAEKQPFRQEIVETVNGASVVFESSTKPYALDSQKTSLLKQGDTVYVKTCENTIYEIKRK